MAEVNPMTEVKNTTDIIEGLSQQPVESKKTIEELLPQTIEPVKSNSVFEELHYKNIEKLCELFFTSERTMTEKIKEVFSKYHIIYDELVVIMLEVLESKNKLEYITSNNIIDRIKSLSYNKYSYYLLFYCYYCNTDVLYAVTNSIDSLITYINLGGDVCPHHIKFALEKYYHISTKEKLLHLVSILPIEQMLETFRYDRHGFLIEKFGYVVMNRMQIINNALKNDVLVYKNELTRVKKHHEEEIKELLIPGNKGAKAAESRFKETTRVVDKSLIETKSLDDKYLDESLD